MPDRDHTAGAIHVGRRIGGARNGLESLNRKAAIVTGSPRVTPPFVERTATMPVRGDQKTSVSAPFGWTTGITPVTGM